MRMRRRKDHLCRFPLDPIRLQAPKIDSETGQIRSDLRRLEDEMDSGFAQMKNLLENASLRADLEASREHR